MPMWYGQKIFAPEPSDGRMLNETIVCEGYSNALTRYPFRQDYIDRFRTCERQAREQGKGLWGEGLAAPAKVAPQPVSAAEGEIKGNRKSQVYSEHPTEGRRLTARAQAVFLPQSARRSKEAVCSVHAVGVRIPRGWCSAPSVALGSGIAVRVAGLRMYSRRSSVATVARR